MASLPVKYDKRLRKVLGYRAVWEPGAPVSLGAVMTLKRGLLVDQANLSDFGVSFRRKKRQAAQLSLNAQGVSETLVQAGVEVPSVSALTPSGKAELKVKFGRSDTYSLRSTSLSGEDISNLLHVARAVAKLADWRFRDFYVVWRILTAKDFTFLGSLQKNREISFSGTGKAIEKYLNAGVSAGISRSSGRKLDLELIGEGGPVAIGVTRITRKGRTRDV